MSNISMNSLRSPSVLYLEYARELSNNSVYKRYNHVNANNLRGFFAIIKFYQSDFNNPCKALFIFFDLNKGEITSYDISNKKSYYKEFNLFINSTLKLNAIEGPCTILTPKNYLNQKTSDYWRNVKIDLVPYTDYTKNLPSLYRFIKNSIKSNPFSCDVPTNNGDLYDLISKLNKSTSIFYSENNFNLNIKFLPKSFKPLINCARRFSTLVKPNKGLHAASLLDFEKKRRENISGIFIIFNSNVKGDNPLSKYLFYNNNTGLIEHWEFHSGGAYYKCYGDFIVKTLPKIKLNGNECINIFAPKYYINPTLINYAKSQYNIILNPLSIHEEKKYNQIIDGVKVFLKKRVIKSGNHLEIAVNDYNMTKIPNKNTFINKSLSQIRKFTTQAFRANADIKTMLIPDYNDESEILKLKPGTLDLLHHRYKEIEKITKPKKWFNSDPYEYKDLGPSNYEKPSIKAVQNILNEFNSEGSYSMLIYVMDTNGDIKTLSRQILINKQTNIRVIMKFIKSCMDSLTVRYGGLKFERFLCKYRRLHGSLNIILDTEDTIKPIRADIKSHISESESISPWLSDLYLPLSMDLSNYGHVIEEDGNTVKFHYKGRIIDVKILDQGHHEILIKSGNIEIFIEDLVHEDSFIRMIKSDNNANYLLISNGKVVNVEYEIITKFIKTLKKHSRLNKKFATFDIETYKNSVDGSLDWSIPYAVGFYNGKKTYKYYLTNYKDSEDMLVACLKTLITNCNGRKVYAHNLSGFDINLIFLILHKHFTVTDINSIDNRIISITAALKVDGDSEAQKSAPKIIFRDSNKLIPGSLKSLGKSYNVEVVKDIFPYKFVNPDNLLYNGPLPDIKYFNQDPETIKAYNQISKTRKKYNWSLRGETMKYLDKDLISLYQIVDKVWEDTYAVYGLNIGEFQTISSLSTGVFRSNFLPEGDILSSSRGALDSNIRAAYYGGAVDVYRPIGSLIHYYDCNSLYPTAMKCPMPVGTPIHSKIKDLNKIFGYVKATIKTPDNIYTPVLPVKVVIDNAVSLTFPKGTWTGWYFSEELKYAVKHHGYEVVVHESYIYKKDFTIFHEFVDTLGLIKQTSVGARRNLAKLIMNALYGRMGMHHDRVSMDIVSDEKLDLILKTSHVVDHFSLWNDDHFVRFNPKPDLDLCMRTGQDFNALTLAHNKKNNVGNNSVAIAAATTAWGRIIMNPLKCIPDNKFYYGDTDSAILEKPLPDEMVGNNIGQFKLEYPLIKEGIFIAPKLYYLLLEDGSVIVKNKGYSGKLTYDEFTRLYHGGNIPTVSQRFKPDLKLGTVVIHDQEMNISGAFNKRNKLYSLGNWVNTSPHYVTNGIISNLDLILYNRVTSLVDVNTLNHFISKILYLPIYSINSIVWPGYPHPYVIHLTSPLPEVIYLHSPIPNVIHLPGSTISLICAPTYLALPIPNIKSLIWPGYPAPYIIILPAPIPEVIYLPPPIPKVINQPFYCLTSKPNIIGAKSVLVYNILDQTNTIYPSYSEASRALDVPICTISRRLKNNNLTPYKQKYIFSA
jgi:hypothetical protein